MTEACGRCHVLITLLFLIILCINIFQLLCNSAKSLTQDSIQWNEDSTVITKEAEKGKQRECVMSALDSSVIKGQEAAWELLMRESCLCWKGGPFYFLTAMLFHQRPLLWVLFRVFGPNMFIRVVFNAMVSVYITFPQLSIERILNNESGIWETKIILKYVRTFYTLVIGGLNRVKMQNQDRQHMTGLHLHPLIRRSRIKDKWKIKQCFTIHLAFT